MSDEHNCQTDEKDAFYSDLREMLNSIKGSQNNPMTQSGSRSVSNLPITMREAVILISAIVSLVVAGVFSWVKIETYMETSKDKQVSITNQVEELESELKVLRSRVLGHKDRIMYLEWVLQEKKDNSDENDN